MKKLLIFVTFFFLAAISTFAQDVQKKVKLSDDHTKEQVRLDYCNIFVTMTDIDDDGNAKVTVEIENLDKSNVIILFGQAYSEKYLKKRLSITFDKIYSGSKGEREIESFREARNKDFLVEAKEQKKLPEISVRSTETYSCRLPLYVAGYKEKKFLGKSTRTNKLLLKDKQIVELEIEVEVKPDEDFIRLEKDCNDLIEKISQQTFCTHPKHKISLDSQEAPYKKEIAKIKTEIDEILSRNEDKWYSKHDRRYEKYNGLKQKLDAIDFTNYEGDCGNPKNHRTIPPRRHTCKYCNLSLQQIYHKLDDYYKKIYNSSNRKATKDAVMSDVNLLYRCCTDATCTKHSSWNNSEYKSKITDRYNRISNF